jgi:hypothetical protein
MYLVDLLTGHPIQCLISGHTVGTDGNAITNNPRSAARLLKLKREHTLVHRFMDLSVPCDRPSYTKSEGELALANPASKASERFSVGVTYSPDKRCLFDDELGSGMERTTGSVVATHGCWA